MIYGPLTWGSRNTSLQCSVLEQETLIFIVHISFEHSCWFQLNRPKSDDWAVTSNIKPLLQVQSNLS